MTDTQILDTHASCIKRVQRYISDHMDEPLDREVLASVVGFSVPHLHRIFIGTVGESVASYVRRMRLKRAGFKLRMGATDITQVALAAGYATHAAFGKAFKQQYGYSPSEFRELDCWSATRILTQENKS